MKNYKKILSCLLSVMIVLSAGVVIPASVPAVSAKTKSAKTLKKPTKLKAKMLTDFEVEDDGARNPVSLSWKKVKNAKKYEIYRAKLNSNGKGKFKKLKAVKKNTYTDKTVKGGTYYKYKVARIRARAISSLKIPHPLRNKTEIIIMRIPR